MTAPEGPSRLDGVQRATTRVLAELDRVCERLGIRYAVYGGTAIGAVRHRGFIPWDDDADVCLPRADYERLLDEAPALLGEAYVLVSPRHSEDYPQTFAVLGLKGSEFVSQVAKDRPYRMPIGVDLFPLDPIPDDEAAYRRQSRSTWLWGRLLFLRGTPRAATGLPGPLAPLAGGIMLAVHATMRALRISPRRLQRAWERAARRHEHSGSTLLGDFSTRDPKHWAVRVDELFPCARVPFEDITVMLPKEYDAILTRGYGDYMELPPADQRVNHEAHSVVYGPYWDEDR
ncbi:LicD family protein [Actinomyces sp. B33]|uniref:LicD family protein n=1 Tax=Actinomyces sp. B33 TaxID=2942131 RepID=UPI002340756F|nr:LicD family protein [Actinomyces sp. B33]MDC4232643.1 LicD family protein [Actinomyces sp. B33]